MTELPISVLLPVYNGGGYLQASVRSVLEQGFRDFELVIVDDCSTDGSREFLDRLTDPRVRVFRNEANRGLFPNLNFLVRQSRGRLVKLWSQDDVMYPDCLEAVVAFHHRYPEVGFSYSGRDIIDGNGRITGGTEGDPTPAVLTPEQHARIAYYTGSIAGNIANVCISRAALERVGPFNEAMKISGDFDMWVRLAEHHDTGFLPGKLVQIRDHQGQLSRQEALYFHHVREDLQVFRYLNSYVGPALRREGRVIIRQQKLVFYYTLMVKALLRGRLRTAARFYRELAGYEGMAVLTMAFLKAKLVPK